MKKKILAAVAVSIVGAASLAGCNKQMVDLNLKFDKARINMGDEWIDVELKKWTDYEDGDQLQLTLEDGTVMVVHSMNCILYKGTLPGGNE